MGEDEPKDTPDPEVILNDLPERERPVFTKVYREAALAAANDLAAYKILGRKLDRWAAKARILQKALQQNPNYYAELDAEVERVRNGTVETYPFEEIAEWRAKNKH